MTLQPNRRVLIIDDNQAIHTDFDKIIGIGAARNSSLDQAAASLFDEEPVPESQGGFDLAFAFQGEQGFNLVRDHLARGERFALAFVDVRMPPGWDGIETVRRIWEIDPDLQIVICTAYSDYSWADMIEVLGENDRLLILKKPFDNIEVRQITSSLVAKWNLSQQANRTMADLQEMVQERTKELDSSNQLLRQEVGERIRSEEALREADAWTRAILETAPDGILTIDQQGMIDSLNGAAARMFGYQIDELRGTNIAAIAPQFPEILPDKTPAAQTETPQVLTHHHPLSGLHREGHGVPIEIGLSQLSYKGQVMYTAIIRDMTEQKKLESQLIQAQKLESIGQLAAGIAHEINTPTQYVNHNTMFLKDAFGDLTGVLDQVQALLASAENHQVSAEALDRLEAAVQTADVSYLRNEIPKVIDQSLDGVGRVAAIVRAIREFSHPGDSVNQKVNLDLNRAIESTAIVARNEWILNSDMVSDFDPNLPPVPCYAAELNQVILNLIVNASHAIVEAQQQGLQARGQIGVRTRQEGNWCRIEISDNGIGIPSENRSKIFDPFFTTKQVGKGTGQGLAIARTIVVKKHGGELNYTSEPGKGTTFVVRLPLALESELASV